MAPQGKNMAYWKAKNQIPSPAKQEVDPDAPGTPGEPGYEPPVHAMDYLTRTPVGPVATQDPAAMHEMFHKGMDTGVGEFVGEKKAILLKKKKKK